MAEIQIDGNLRIVDGSTKLKTLKELNAEIINLNNTIKEYKPICLYDKDGIDGPSLGYTSGIQGSKSVAIDFTPYKKVTVYGIMNVRKYQFHVDIILSSTDYLCVFDNINVYMSHCWLSDNIYDNMHAFIASVGITKDKKSLKAMRFAIRPFNNWTALSARDNSKEYYISKVYGYKY